MRSVGKEKKRSRIFPKELCIEKLLQPHKVQGTAGKSNISFPCNLDGRNVEQ